MNSQSRDVATGVEKMQDERDIELLAVARVQEADAERVPAAIVGRLAAGENPVRVWRDHRGFSSENLAQLSEIGIDALNRIEAGEAGETVPGPVLARLALALKVDRDDLMPWNPTPGRAAAVQ